MSGEPIQEIPSIAIIGLASHGATYGTGYAQAHSLVAGGHDFEGMTNAKWQIPTCCVTLTANANMRLCGTDPCADEKVS